jgi:hypothetical protein
VKRKKHAKHLKNQEKFNKIGVLKNGKKWGRSFLNSKRSNNAVLLIDYVRNSFKKERPQKGMRYV